jgi:hypothetical protein
MSAEAAEPDYDPEDIPVAKALDVSSPTEVPRIRTPFKIDGELMWATKPKGGVLMAMARDYNAHPDDELGEVKMIEAFLDICMEPEAADRIRERLSDPDDAFDVDTLVPLVQALQTAWSGRQHTGKPSTSSPRRRRTGRR